jgi:hypothetical protein
VIAGLSNWFGGNRHVLARPLKRAAIIGLLAVLGLFAHTTYTIHQVSSTVEPIDSSLKRLSSQTKGNSQRGASGASWTTTYRFPDERLNRESYGLIREALQADGWDLLEESTALLPDNLMGGYLIRAEKWGYTYVAYLPKSGDDLQIDVAESGEPQVSRPLEEMEITGR